MRRISKLLLVIICLVFGIKATNAMTEEELYKKMTKTYTINGAEFKIENDTQVLLERYLKQYDVSSKDADYIAKQFDEAVTIVKASGKTNTKDMSTSTKEKLKVLVENVTANTSVKATVTKNSLVIYTPDGTKEFAEVTKLIKQTGTTLNVIDILIVSLSLLFILIGSCLIFRKLNSK